jgi:hypothetical protein
VCWFHTETAGVARNCRNVETAILLGHHRTGVTIVSPWEEAAELAGIPLASLLNHGLPVDPSLLSVLTRWGVHTCGDLAALPEEID